MKINTEERARQARQLFENGLNCAQAVAGAYSDVCGVEATVLENLTLALGGGLGRQREVCGTVSGASIVLGAVEAAKGGDNAKMKAYKLVQDFSGDFREENGSIICRELLALGKGENANPEPTPRTEKYYKKRPCGDYVEFAARRIGEIINKMQE